MKWWPVVAIVAVLLAAAGGIWFWQSRSVTPGTSSGTNSPATPAVSVDEYDTRSHSIALGLSSAVEGDVDVLRTAGAQAKRELMQLIVPKDKRDAHLALVLALTRLETATDAALITQARSAIQKALRPFLSAP